MRRPRSRVLTRSAKGTSKPPPGARSSSTRSVKLSASVQVKLLRISRRSVSSASTADRRSRATPRPRGYEQEPAGIGLRRKVPRGLVFPPGGCGRQGATPCGSGGRHCPGGEGLPAQRWHRAWQALCDLRARCAARLECSPLAGKCPQVAEPGAAARSSWRMASASPPVHLELTDTLGTLPPQTLKEARESVEREMVQDALLRHRAKITSVGISRPVLRADGKSWGLRGG